MKNRKPVVAGIIGGLALLVIYFGIVSFANSFDHALTVFGNLWYWIALLTIGFGFQVGLYVYVRQTIKNGTKGATAEVATAGGISTGSMIACCAHHVTDLLPILGLGAAAMFLTQFQTSFILLGVFSNLVGITMMLHIIGKHNLAGASPLLQKLTRINTKNLRNGAIVVSVIAVAISFAVTSTHSAPMPKQSSQMALSEKPVDLPALNNSENSVSIDAKPIDFTYNKPVTIAMALNTHHGSLDYDLSKISVLVCDQGKTFKPIRWEGSAPGGHHRRGELVFPEIDHKVSHLKLVVKDIYNVPERVFDWNIS